MNSRRLLDDDATKGLICEVCDTGVFFPAVFVFRTTQHAVVVEFVKRDAGCFRGTTEKMTVGFCAISTWESLVADLTRLTI